MGRIFRFSLKAICIAAILYAGFTFLPEAQQERIEDALSTPIAIFQDWRFESYYWICQFFGSSPSEALQHAADFNVNERTDALRQKMEDLQNSSSSAQ